MSPTSVGGGLRNEGNWLSSAGFLGPGSDRPAGLALIAPCAGESGLPNEAAWAAVATTAAPPAAPSARISRREKGTMGLSLLAELEWHGSNAARAYRWLGRYGLGVRGTFERIPHCRVVDDAVVACRGDGHARLHPFTAIGLAFLARRS